MRGARRLKLFCQLVIVVVERTIFHLVLFSSSSDAFNMLGDKLGAQSNRFKVETTFEITYKGPLCNHCFVEMMRLSVEMHASKLNAIQL